MVDKELIEVLNRQMDAGFHNTLSAGELREKLIEFINHLIQKDFEKLVSILYRVDVNEKKLKTLLKASPGTDAAVLIADLILERELQKIKTRNTYKNQ